MTPKFIQRRIDEQEQKQKANRLQSTREALEARRLREDGSAYFDALLDELKQQCESLPKINMRGNAYPMPNPHCPSESCCRVDVQANILAPVMASSTFQWSKGSNVIRVHGNIPKLTELDFHVDEGELKTSSNRNFAKYMNASECAEYILDEIVKVIEKELAA